MGDMDSFDLLIVGGGINGAAIARDAAGRGLTVLLVEKDDLASHTSSASSKLIHGGLRYLEQYEFRLVRESLHERAILLANENAKAAGLDSRFVACTPEQVPSNQVFDEIWSNPPIRIGKEALHELLLTWLPRLAPDGRMVMVVGKFLGADSLQRWLGEQGWPTTRLGSHKGFRVLETRRA